MTFFSSNFSADFSELKPQQSDRITIELFVEDGGMHGFTFDHEGNSSLSDWLVHRIYSTIDEATEHFIKQQKEAMKNE